VLSSDEVTLVTMMLTEPGSRVDGPTEDVLRSIFATTLELLEETLPADEADTLALRHLARVHADLADRGYVVRLL